MNNNMRNQPVMRNAAGEQLVPKFIHQPFTLEYHGINAEMQTNGKVKFSKAVGPDPKNPAVTLFDEIEIPAAFIYKVNDLLKMTVRKELVPISSVKGSQNQTENLEG